MIRWPRPKDEAVPRIAESWLNSLILEPQEILVDDELLEVGVQELFGLLGVSLCPVDGVEGLDLGLDEISWEASGKL